MAICYRSPRRHIQGGNPDGEKGSWKKSEQVIAGREHTMWVVTDVGSAAQRPELRSFSPT